MHAISDDIKLNILSLLAQGLSTRQVADQCSVSQSVVARLRKTRLPTVPEPRGGRREKLSAQDKRSCVRAITSGQLDTAAAVTKRYREDTGIDISSRTVRRAFNQAGLKAGEKETKPKLSAKNIKARLDFARRHRDWTVADWSRVIWSDETKINRFCSDGRSWCWIRDGETRQPRNVKQTVKHGGGSLMVWGCMTAQGPGNIHRIQGTMTQHAYKQILETQLLETIQKFDMDASRVIFQHDNDPKHTAKSVQEWLGEQQFEVLDWPAQSPDLNPIEHLWAMLKRRLNQYETPPSGMLELRERIQTQWSKIDNRECARLVESMPRRIEAVLSAKGMWTDY